MGLLRTPEHCPTGGPLHCLMFDPVKSEEGQGSPVTQATWSTVCCMQHEHASGLHGHESPQGRPCQAGSAVQMLCCNCTGIVHLGLHACINSTIWLWKLVLKGTLLAATQKMLRQ